MVSVVYVRVGIVMLQQLLVGLSDACQRSK